MYGWFNSLAGRAMKLTWWDLLRFQLQWHVPIRFCRLQVAQLKELLSGLWRRFAWTRSGSSDNGQYPRLPLCTHQCLVNPTDNIREFRVRLLDLDELGLHVVVLVAQIDDVVHKQAEQENVNEVLDPAHREASEGVAQGKLLLHEGEFLHHVEILVLG